VDLDLHVLMQERPRNRKKAFKKEREQGVFLQKFPLFFLLMAVVNTTHV
jgi:hypothetical protein